MKRGKSPKTVAVNPHVVRALEARFAEGKKYEEGKDFATAEKIYREIINTYQRHGYNPASPYGALGYALMHQRKLDEAEKAFQKSAAQDAGLFQTHVNLAVLYHLEERWKDCITASKRALAINPKSVQCLVGLGQALYECRHYALSVQNFLLALSLDKDSLDACKGLAMNYVALGETSVSIPMFRKLIAANPNAWPTKSSLLFSMQYEPTLSNDEVWQEHLDYGSTLRTVTGPPDPLPSHTNAGSRLRLGYMSADFQYHVVMRFVEEVLKLHDRNKFELTLIMTCAKEDEDSQRIRGHADHWLNIGSLDDERAAGLIREKKLDLLVDLSGHSAGTRLPLLSRRLAPIQISWCGYSGTSGVEAVDYIIVDNVLSPRGEKTYFLEHPLRLPSSFVSFASPSSPEIQQLPFVKNKYVTFGCMNNPSKINKYVVAWWAEILKQVPDGKLLLRYAHYADTLVCERIRKMFDDCGVPADRYLMLEGNKDFITVYNDVDIALDTFPYNGTTTTCEALWMGVPVVALRGDRFVARVSASLLTHVGLRDLVAETPPDYIDIAVRLAHNAEQLTNFRQTLRSHLSTTPVFNAGMFTKILEETYLNVYKTIGEPAREASLVA